MTSQEGSLQEKLSAAVHWEQTKRRESILLTALCYALLGSLLLLPVKHLLPSWLSPHMIPLALFLFLALGMRFLNPWTKRDSLLTMVRLDKTLELQERVLTAWEIFELRERRPAALLVLAEAERGLEGAEPRALFKRRLSWPATFTPLFFLLWFLGAWTDMGTSNFARQAASFSPLAQRLKDLSRALEEKAKAQGLTETLEMARALDQVARKIAEGSESEAKENLKALGQKIDDKISARRPDLDWGQAPADELSDLRGRLKKVEGSRSLRSGAEEEWIKKLLQGLASLPWLSPESQKALAQSGSMGEGELRSLAAKLDQEIMAELDRRSLEEMSDLLGLMMPGEGEKMAQGQRGEDVVQGSEEVHRTEGGESTHERRGAKSGSLPGDKPGEDGFPTPPPSFKARAATHLKGLLGEGKRSGLGLRGGAGGKQSQVPEDEVLTSYRRQAEEELAREEIPEGLKEVVKKYFLSLGMGER